MAWVPSSDPRSSHLLLIYCFLSTLFCLRFIHLANQNAQACDQHIHHEVYNTSLNSPGFPRKIWQTSKTGAAGIEGDDRKAIQSWIKLNQKHRYEIVTQYSAESYIRDKFNHRADIQETFLDLQDPILRADLIRYLVLLGDGGVYSDIDTMCLMPMEDWVPSIYKDKVNLVIGIEYDSLGHDRWLDWSLDLQFATWAILARPGHLAMEVTVDRVIQKLQRLARNQETTISGIKPTFRDVLDSTGPALFTEAVFESLSFATGSNFTWQNVSGLTTARLVSDVLILPINAFGSGQAHSNSGSPDSDTALVQHLFKGSWKVEHPLDGEKEAKERVEKAEEQANVQNEEQDTVS